MGGTVENFLGRLWIKFTGLDSGEGMVASSHFHSMAFWSSLFPLLAVLIGNKWVALGGLPWGGTVVISEAGAKGRWIDVVTRGSGCLIGFVFSLIVLLT